MYSQARGDRVNVFVSYSTADRRWAEWLAWRIEQGGSSATIQAWDFTPGSNFVVQMHQAIQEADRVVLVLSPDFLRSEFTTAEWTAALAGDPTGNSRRLLPVKVRPCRLEGLLGQVVHIDLVGASESDAARMFDAALSNERLKPETQPSFPLTPNVDGATPGTAATDDDWYFSNLPPKSPSLSQLLPIPTDVGSARAAWRESLTGPIEIDVGLDRDGRTVRIDLAKDGPCGIVVGTSGAGTSELLRVMCASAAIRYPPSRVRLQLVDLKGGGAWAGVEKLPHVAAIFNDWPVEASTDSFVTFANRLLDSKEAALRRSGVADIGAHNRLNPESRLPVDIVAVDEMFGDLLEDSLVHVQRRGRALGVAVIAGTQSLTRLGHQFVTLARFGIFMGDFGLADTRNWHLWASSPLSERQGRQRPPTGRALLGTGSGVIPFQAGWTGGWAPGIDDSLYRRSAELDDLAELLSAAAESM